MNTVDFRRWVHRAAALYCPAGRAAEYGARGKLAGDPVYRALLSPQLIPDGSRVLDLGCGRALLAAWLKTVRQDYDAGQSTEWADPPPRLGSYQGIELMAADAQCARIALGSEARMIITGDMQTAVWDQADVVVMLDVLYFLEPAAQEKLLARVRRDLPINGLLLIRVADAAAGPRFWWTLLVDHIAAAWRGHGFSRFHCRPLGDWTRLLERLGFSCETQPMSAGTPFHNILIVARPENRRGLWDVAPSASGVQPWHPSPVPLAPPYRPVANLLRPPGQTRPVPVSGLVYSEVE